MKFPRASLEIGEVTGHQVLLNFQCLLRGPERNGFYALSMIIASRKKGLTRRGTSTHSKDSSFGNDYCKQKVELAKGPAI